MVVVAEGPVGAQPAESSATDPKLLLELDVLTERIEQNAADAWATARRGGVWFKLGNNNAALRDFDRAIELDPRLKPELWQRGISLYYAERWDDCLDQFVSHRTVNPDDVENAAWHFLCGARRDGVAAARRALLPVGPDFRVPMDRIYALYAGKGDRDSVLAMAQEKTVGVREHQLFYAHLYLALWDEVHGREEPALEHLDRAVAISFPHYMGDVARWHRTWLVAASLQDPEP